MTRPSNESLVTHEQKQQQSSLNPKILELTMDLQQMR